MGGAPDETLLEYLLDLAPGRRLLYVPTAGMEDPARTVWWYERLRGRAEMTHLHFFPWPPSGLRELTLDHDVILVTGGNTANALAIWRTHGFDEILREAWQQGILLTGWSAGMICWFKHGVTDRSPGVSLWPARARTTTYRRAAPTSIIRVRRQRAKGIPVEQGRRLWRTAQLETGLLASAGRDADKRRNSASQASPLSPSQIGVSST